MPNQTNHKNHTEVEPYTSVAHLPDTTGPHTTHPAQNQIQIQTSIIKIKNFIIKIWPIGKLKMLCTKHTNQYVHPLLDVETFSIIHNHSLHHPHPECNFISVKMVEFLNGQRMILPVLGDGDK